MEQPAKKRRFEEDNPIDFTLCKKCQKGGGTSVPNKTSNKKFLECVSLTLFTRAQIEIGSENYQDSFGSDPVLYSVYTGSDPKLFAFTWDRINLCLITESHNLRMRQGKLKIGAISVYDRL